MKWITILLILALLVCGSGIASAANTTSDTTISDTAIGGIIEMSEVKTHGASVWSDLNKGGGAGYVLLALGFIGWMLLVMAAAFGGSAEHALGNSNKNADTAKKGTDRLTRVAVAIIAPPIMILLLKVFVGLI